MSAVVVFQDIETLCQTARESFRSDLLAKQTQFGEVVDLLFRVLRSIGKLKPAVEWHESRQEWVLGLVIQALEIVLAMYYLSESGFWDNALALKRNYVELLTTAIAIGYDEACYVDWRHARKNASSFGKLYRRAADAAGVPQMEKDLLPVLKNYWAESSQGFSHKVKVDAVRALVTNGEARFEPKIAEAAFGVSRLNALRNMTLNLISTLLGIFDYSSEAYRRKDEFPEAISLIQEYNRYFADRALAKEKTN